MSINFYRYDGTNPLKLTLQITMVDVDGNAVDLTAATDATMNYRLADGTTGSWTADFALDRTSGIITYDLVAGDFPLGEGVHQVAGVVTWADSSVSISDNLLEFGIKDTWDQ